MAAFNANLKGKVSSPIAGNSGVIALRVENIGASANPQDAEALKQQIIGAQKNVSYRGGTNALKNAATIKDNRSKFY